MSERQQCWRICYDSRTTSKNIQIDIMNCLICSEPLLPKANFCSACGSAVLAELDLIQHSLGKSHLPHAFSPDICKAALTLADEPAVRGAFARYLLYFAQDAKQLIHGRTELIAEIEKAAKVHRIQSTQEFFWCVLCVVAELYFADKRKTCSWTAAQETQLKGEWFELLAGVFLAEGTVVDLQTASADDWRERFLELEKLEDGPLPACSVCTSKCLYNTEVSWLVSDKETKTSYLSATNNMAMPATESAAIFCNLRALQHAEDPPLDLQFCFAAHLVSTMNLSDAGQVFFARSVRSKLAEFAGIEAQENEEHEDNVHELGSPVADFASASLRRTVFDIIVKQAHTDPDWRIHLHEVMMKNKIKPEDVEAELRSET
jgi:hypothetical protein